MQDFLKDILVKKNLINILVLSILVLAIPLTAKLVKEQQILFSKAATDSVQLIDNECTSVRSSTKVLTCPKLNLKFVAPSQVDILSAQGLVKTAYADETVTACGSSHSLDDLINQVHAAGYTGPTDAASVIAAYENAACPGGSSGGGSCTSGAAGSITAAQASCVLQVRGDVLPFYQGNGWCSQPIDYPGIVNNWMSINSATDKSSVASCFGGGGGGGSCTIGKACTCSGASAGSCNQCDGGWCNGGQCSTCSSGGGGGGGGSCPAGSCCASGLPRCGTTSTFNPGSSIDTSCPSGYQWCYGSPSGGAGYCVNQNYKPATGSCTSNPGGGPTPTINLEVTPNPVNRTPGSLWPNANLQVTSSDASYEWSLFYRSDTCSVSSCGLSGWAAIPNGTGSGSRSVTWGSGQSVDIQNVPVGTHTFGVLDKGLNKVLAVKDVSFTEGGSPPPSGKTYVKVRYAQNEADLSSPSSRVEVPYTSGGVSAIINFSDTSINKPKFVFVEFITSTGEVEKGRPYPFKIDLVGAEPILTGVACNLDITGANNRSDLIFNLAGSGFGPAAGKINIVGGTGTITSESWSDASASGRLMNPSTNDTATGTTYRVTITNKDGITSNEQTCKVGVTQISLGAKLFCRTLRNFDQDNVELTLYLDKDHTKKSTEKVIIDKEGNITNIKTKLQSGENYIACIKAPSSIRNCSLPFAALSGNNILNMSLAVGDYNQDGVINNPDQSLLKSQWGPMNPNKVCDLNRDSVCNSFEWSCQLRDFNARDKVIN